MIDVISGGRLIAGFPVGTPMDTCFAYGTEPVDAARALLEAHDLVVRAWTEQDTFAFNGRFNQQRYVNIWPRPMQQPHPPIWIPGGGSVETWRWCAEMDYVYCYLSYYGYKAGAGDMDGFWAEMDRLGKDRNPYRAGFAAGRRRRREPRAGDRALPRGGRVLLRPLPAHRPALRRAAGLRHRGDAARRHPGPDQDGGARQAASGRPPTPRSAQKMQSLARDMEGDRRQRLRDHRLAGRGRRAIAGGGAPRSMSATSCCCCSSAT